MIIGTAGHIDHGKTTLVHALTGVDTDRLPEEKRRGISIDLGYAYLDGGPHGERLGFIDVPGHERLLHTMLAGTTGIDHALLLVAADDGVMPQTREHLAVLTLLGIRSMTVALTKIDRVEAARVAAVREQVRGLLALTGWHHEVPLFEVCAPTGAGVERLQAHLLSLPVPNDEPAGDLIEQGFHLAVDRAFTLDGIGTVATGTVQAGQVQAGSELVLLPGGRPVRVRSLHAQNRAADRATRGQRCALALAGIERTEVRRGDVLCAPAVALTSDRLDVMLLLWGDEAQPLASGTAVHVHLGTRDVLGRVDLLEAPSLAPGRRALAQLVLAGPVAAWRGDRVVLRDAAAQRTVGGAQVLDPFGAARHRRSPLRLQALRSADLPRRPARWQALAATAPAGLDVARQARAEGLMHVPTPTEGLRWVLPLAFSEAHWQSLQQRLLQALASHHAEWPEELGPTAERLRRRMGQPLAEPAWQALLETMRGDGALVRQGPWLHLPDHAVRLNAQEARLEQQVLPLLLAAGLDPPWLRDLAATLHLQEAALRPALQRIARRGELFPVVRDLYYHQRPLAQLAALARTLASRDGVVRAADFRDASGLGRKRAIQVLEFFDRVGLLRRVRDTHVLRPECALFATPEELTPMAT